MGEDDTSNHGFAAQTGTKSSPIDTTSENPSRFVFDDFVLGNAWNLSEDFYSRFDYSKWFEYPLFAAWYPWSGYNFSSRLQTPQGCHRSPTVGTVPSFAGAVLLTLVLIRWFKPTFWRSVRNRHCKNRINVRVHCENPPTETVGNLPFEQVRPVKPESQILDGCIKRDEFLNTDTATWTTPYFYVVDGVLQCAGYDSSQKLWHRLPPLDYLPDFCTPDPDLFKQYLVCTHNGIVCMNVSKSTSEKLVVFNPLTKQWNLLPPLNHRRNPVLMHLIVDAANYSFQLLIAGSSRLGDEHLSRITEVFDSATWTWTRTGDIPGPDYALNEYQSGVCKDGFIFCVAFLSQQPGRGILRYNLSKGTWLKNWTYPLPFAVNTSILQLVENMGEVYLFSEQESEEGGVEQCIDVLECTLSDQAWNLRNIVRNKKLGGRSLEIYPEYVCVGFSEFQLCIFHTIGHSGVVFDVKSCEKSEIILDAPAGKDFGGERFDSLNPLSFPFRRFRSSPVSG